MDNWVNILDEKILKSNVEFAAIYILYFECLKDFIITQVKDFYCDEFHYVDNEVISPESEAYKREVRSLDPQIENASLKWFMKGEAITQEDYDTYQILRKKRNEITHEFLKNINNGFTEEDAKLFGKMNELYQKLDKWWINEIEIPIAGEEIPENYDRDGVCGGQALVLSIISDIIFGSEEDKIKYKELLKDIMN